MITIRAIEQFDTILHNLSERLTQCTDAETRRRLQEQFALVYQSKLNYIQRNK